MRTLFIGIPLLAATLMSAGTGLFQLDVDVFNLLPSDSRMVEGLKLYHHNFGASKELLLSVRTPEAERTESAVHSLANSAEEAGLASYVVLRSPLRDDPEALAELLAYTWFNQPQEEFARLAERFEQDRLEPRLDRTLETIATSLRPQEVARLSHDPYALTDLPGGVSALMLENAGDPFASRDGRLRILFLEAPFEEAGFWDYQDWVKRVKALVRDWQGRHAADGSIEVGITGDPAFVAETGSGLLRDMRLAALGTLFVVTLLFWVAHRRWGPLIWLVALLLFVVIATVMLGSIWLGRLNAVSLGFAAILLGLAADYGLLLYQEFIAHPSRSLKEHRAAVAPSILWAAATTALAFWMISRSSLPGLTQLGKLVALGVALAAVVMLVAFLPPLVRRQRRNRTIAEPAAQAPGAKVNGRPAWAVTLAAVGISAAVLFVQLPSVDYTTDHLGPKDSQARKTIVEIEQEILGEGDPLWLMVRGVDEGEVAAGLERSRDLLDRAIEDGLVTEHALPDAFWPRPEAQQANRETVRRLAALHGPARIAALHAGFASDGLELTDRVFAAWERFAAQETVQWPSRPASQWAFRKFAARSPEQLIALGRLDVAEDVSSAELLGLDDDLESSNAGRLFGWPLLSESLLGIMQRDIKRVLLPLAVVLILALGMAFRRVGEIALSLAALGFSLLCLLALTSLLGWSWNLMNLMALPLLFGAGIDYSIHIQLALRRSGGDVRLVRRTVGRAILLCGASTATGFGTLAFASNAGVASLGRVCAAGILIAGFTSIVLLPIWWRRWKSLTGKIEA